MAVTGQFPVAADNMPGRLLVIGDSLCTFNPLYGQGMTIAALQAETLTSVLRRHLHDPADLPGLVESAQKAVAKCTTGAWLVATGSDLRYPCTTGAQATFATRLLQRHLDLVFAAATADPSVNAAFLRVLNMIDAPQALFRPGTMARALLGSAARQPISRNRHTQHPPGGNTMDTAAFTITHRSAGSTRPGTTTTWRLASSRCWRQNCTADSWSVSDPDRGCSTSVVVEGNTPYIWPTGGPMCASSAWICRRS
jgi:hypothetical protein